MTIREARQKAGVTQFELSRRTRIHPSQLSKLESGRLRPTRVEIDRIANAFGLEPSQLAENADVR
jgi:transcriptional regulator with XRE-family HTH domain